MRTQLRDVVQINLPRNFTSLSQHTFGFWEGAFVCPGKEGEKTREGCSAGWAGGWRRQPYPRPPGGSRGRRTAPTSALERQPLSAQASSPHRLQVQNQPEQSQALIRGTPNANQRSPDLGTQDRKGALSGLSVVNLCLPFHRAKVQELPTQCTLLFPVRDKGARPA